MNKKHLISLFVISLFITLLIAVTQFNLFSNLSNAIKVVNLVDDNNPEKTTTLRQSHNNEIQVSNNIQNERHNRLVNNEKNSAIPNELPKHTHLNHGVISKTTLNCDKSNIQEAQNISQAFIKNNINTALASGHLIYHINTCSSSQSSEILSSLFSESSDNIKAMDLVIDLYDKADRKLHIIRAIQSANFNKDQIPSLIEHIKDAPMGIKAALIPDLLRKDDLDSLNKITSFDYMYLNYTSRSGQPYTEKQAAEKTKDLILYSAPNNLQLNSEIYGYLLDTYPEEDTANKLIKLLKQSSFKISHQGETT